MAKPEIDLVALKTAIDAVFEHLTEDLGLKTVPIDDAEDFYWDPGLAAYDVSRKPHLDGVGRLSDDVHFVALIRRGEGGDISYNLVHVAPLLRYIAEKVKG